ncbi:flagellar biosynthetic protein FliO [Arthrobacter bambusae]|uniref:flagellar biosynthetic protein FliO n=1 Tax=Arthrobacter bambusae TaxID=1338426 RepID=UPI00278929AC|nr:flagellar biosynthetic protein FliO [Arthrobacter bambusae]MDQ0029467.1 flagellar protein FliO/FliZ [Arthrobacter bambusae]MDQ0097127.1 flagellar protein FliO/FliZ [Arthrobacter bambusae]
MDSLILGLRVLVALGAVLGLIWVLQRRLLKGKAKGRRRANTTLTVVSRQAVGQKASVVVVDAGDKRFLLGVTEHAINVLHSGDVPMELPESTTAEAPESFADIFRDAGGTPLPDNMPPAAALQGSGLTRRSEIHRRSGLDKAQPMHGSILAGSTWRQAAEAIRGRRN